MGVSVKVAILNIKLNIAKLKLYEYKAKSTTEAGSGNDVDTDDITPPGEQGDGVLMVDNLKQITTLSADSNGLRVVDSGNHIYGFYLDKSGSDPTVTCMLLDEGL